MITGVAVGVVLGAAGDNKLLSLLCLIVLLRTYEFIVFASLLRTYEFIVFASLLRTYEFILFARFKEVKNLMCLLVNPI
jgi:hypothetical protein